VLQTPPLTLPHPELAKRDFVVAPLAEIAPDLVHPVLKKTMLELNVELASSKADKFVLRTLPFEWR